MSRDLDMEGGGAVRVLVVDDSPVDRRVARGLLLAQSGLFEVVTVGSGKSAMEFLGLTEERPESLNTDDRVIDLVLTDYCMPEIDGYHLLRAIKENACLKSLPVFIMSSEYDALRISRCCASGAEEFILKPLKPADIQKLASYVMSSIESRKADVNSRSIDMIKNQVEAAQREQPRLAEVSLA